MKVKKGDQVKILSGKDRGKISDVVAVYPRTEKVLVKDINIVSKFRKTNPNSEKKGGIAKIEMPIHISNVMVINPETGKPSRVGFQMDKEGKKERIFKSKAKKTSKKSAKAESKGINEVNEVETETKKEPKSQPKAKKAVAEKKTTANPKGIPSGKEAVKTVKSKK